MMNYRHYISSGSGAFLCLLFLGLLSWSSCKHDIPQPAVPVDTGNGGGIVTNPCDSDSVYFNLQILPFLVANCAMSGCHDVASHKDGVILTSYLSLINSGIVNPGNPGSSVLVDVITTSDPNDVMPQPPAAPLSNQQIQLIQTWITQGALDLNCDPPCDTLNFTWSGTIRPLIQLKCKGCHQGANPGGGVNLSNYAGVSGSAFDGSLLGSVEHASGWSAMPKNAASLPDCEIIQIRKWVNAGAPNN